MADPNSTDKIEVQCPLCKGTLTIDVATGIVLHAAAPRGNGTDFETALGELRAADGSRERQFADAFKAENARRASLDKKFETAKEKAAADPRKKRINPMDYD